MRVRNLLTTSAAILVLPYLAGCDQAPTAPASGPELTSAPVTVAAASKKKTVKTKRKKRKKKIKRVAIIIDNNVRKTRKGKTFLGCPPGFKARIAKAHPADRNGDGVVCVKFPRGTKKGKK